LVTCYDLEYLLHFYFIFVPFLFLGMKEGGVFPFLNNNIAVPQIGAFTTINIIVFSMFYPSTTLSCSGVL